MAKLDDLIEELRADGREDDAEELEKLSGSALRKKAAEAEKAVKRAEELEAKLADMERKPKVSKAFENAGVDMSSLSRLERKAIEAYDGELDEDAIADFIEENEIVVDAADGGDDEKKEEPTEAEKVTRAARKSAEGRGGKAPVITPDDAASWSAERFARFSEEHPDEAQALLAGEKVAGMTA